MMLRFFVVISIVATGWYGWQLQQTYALWQGVRLAQASYVQDEPRRAAAHERCLAKAAQQRSEDLRQECNAELRDSRAEQYQRGRLEARLKAGHWDVAWSWMMVLGAIWLTFAAATWIKRGGRRSEGAAASG